LAQEEAERIEVFQDAYEERDVPNPEIEPPRYFYYADTVPRTTCGAMPNAIPKSCFLILKEGEPRDFFFEKGPLAYFGSMGGKNFTVQKTHSVFLKNYNCLDALRIEFIDKSFRTVKLPVGSPTAFLTMIVTCLKHY